MMQAGPQFAMLVTVHNRKDKTIAFLEAVNQLSTYINLYVMLVDDGSIDGTAEEIGKYKFNFKIDVINGNGKLFFAGGMRKAFSALACRDYDFIIACNDDVELDINKLKSQLCTYLEDGSDSVFIGQFTDYNGHITYGAWKSKFSFFRSPVERCFRSKDLATFNMNFVIIPRNIIQEFGFVKNYFIHTLADFELGFRYSKAGMQFLISEPIGHCLHNSEQNTSSDKNLSILNRLRKFNSVKEQPISVRIRYLLDVEGFRGILLFLLPYIKIVMRK